MKQAAYASRTSQEKRKSREQLNQEARELKRNKKHRGHAAGMRTNPEAQKKNNKNGNSEIKDPRVGSKKPVSLLVPDNTPVTRQPKKVAAPAKRRPSAEEELSQLENSEQLDRLLNRLEDGDTLSAEEQSWLDQTLDRIDTLMENLGINLDDDADDEESEDMLRLLKGTGH